MAFSDGKGIGMSGILYVVATPIGNLSDLSRRAAETLSAVDLIAAEDTRHSRIILAHLALRKPVVSYHAHNEAQRSAELLRRLQAGEQVALISDAGTPLVSDPGFRLVDLAHRHAIPVVPVPGPSAVITALSAAGLATDRFTFLGFLPSKKKARQELLRSVVDAGQTQVFFESSHRIRDTLCDFQRCFDNARLMAIARELTKQFEEIVRLPVGEAVDWLDSDANRSRGEFVLLLSGVEVPACDAGRQSSEIDRLITLLQPQLPLKKVVEICVDYFGVPKNQVYRMALEQKKKN